MPETVYLIHLDQPYPRGSRGFSQHYLGMAYEDEKERLEIHRAGRGSPFLRAATAKGITYAIVRTWPGGRDLEKRLKGHKKAWRLCPVCRRERAP